MSLQDEESDERERAQEAAALEHALQRSMLFAHA